MLVGEGDSRLPEIGNLCHNPVGGSGMATPRKPRSDFGSKVVEPSPGRPVKGTEHVRAVAARVKAVKDRLDSEGRAANPVLRMTRRSFGRRIGLSDDDAQAEEAVRLRLRKNSPTPFSAEELSRICHEFGVRGDYLLSGNGPMLHTDVTSGRAHADAALSHSLCEHLKDVVASLLDQDEEWVASYLPGPDALLATVERGVADGLVAHIADRVQERKAANAAIRQALAAHMRQASEVPEATAAYFKSATTGVMEGTVIILDEGQPMDDSGESGKGP